jgi:hypothetical protein
MEDKEDQWNKKIVDLTNTIYNCYQDIGILLDDIKKSMLLRKVKIENHVHSRSVWYDLGQTFFLRNDYSLVSYVYAIMLKTIEEYETKHKTQLHRGLALYNLGISQLNQKNYDEGIPNVLSAYQEDKRTYGIRKAENLFAKRLDVAFTTEVNNILESKCYSTLKKLYPGSSSLVNSISDLTSKLEKSEKLLLMRVLISNTNIPFRKDTYTQVVLFDNLKNMLLLIEVVLKKKWNGTLGPLVDQMIKHKNWTKHSPVEVGLRRFDRGPLPPLKQFESNFSNIRRMTYVRNEGKFLVRLFLQTIILRNYTAHFFDDYKPILHHKTLYDSLYDSLFRFATYALIYSLYAIR